MSIDSVVLNEEQQLELSRIAQSRSLPAGYVFRARLILMLAEGASFSTIKQRLGTTAPTIIRWKQRFVSAGLDGLDTSHPGQPASVLTPKLRARILSATRRQPKDGSTHWSCRKLAAELGVSKDAVHRVWIEAGLKPHRLERYMVSDDPEFETKAADIIGLYLNPPQHASIRFCRFPPAGSSAMGSNTTAMERSRCMQPWRLPRAVSMERPPHATPVRTSLPF
jgi:transposase